MSLSILVPVHVEAKVVAQATPVPSLGGGAFNLDATLEPGVHVHWALPDALTRARFIDAEGGRRTLFPGVPDLWLVVRFNPPPSGRAAIGRVGQLPRHVKRSWRAWVVDSRTQTNVRLDDWSPPTSVDAASVHTFAGLLPSAESLGEPGWGVWNNNEQGSFNPAVAAYYPTARGRFGFHDDLADLGTSAGPVSYSVVGWFAAPSQDPLHRSPDRKARMKAWKFAWKARPFHLLPTLVTSAAAQSAVQFIPTSAKVAQAPASRTVQASLQTRNAVRISEQMRQTGRAEAMQRSAQAIAVSAAQVQPGLSTGAGQVLTSTVPSEIVCHGAVVEVPLKPPAAAPPSFEHGDIQVYPSVKTAMAAVASLDDANKVEMVEALLQSLDGQQAKTQSGVLDLPAALHALSFQSAPGKSRFYAQIDVFARAAVLQKAPKLDLSKALSNVNTAMTRQASGHWPAISTRSAAVQSSALSKDKLKDSLQRKPQTAKPYEPTPAELGAWMADVQSALASAASEAEAKGSPIDPAIVRVRDSRPTAQPMLLGPAAGGRGSDGAGYWLDVTDADAMRRFLIAVHGAGVSLPDADRLYELPGPRWYRPWSPQIVVTGQGRSFRFGEDGRFEASGMLRCRVSGETLTSIKTGSGKIVLARNIVNNTAALGSNAGLPPEARALVEETTLFDSSNADEMAFQSLPGAATAALNAAEKSFQEASHALWLLREPDLQPAAKTQILSMVQGREPSPVAYLPWRDPWDPLFADVNYAHPFSSLETDWTLDGLGDKPPSVEFRPLTEAATEPPAGQVEVFDERSFLTSTIVHTLESALVTQLTLDKYGNPVKVGKPPNGVDGQTFKKMAVLSAPLTGFDQALYERGKRQRTGALRLNKLDLIDAFGARRSWISQIADPSSPAGDDTLPWWTALSPRLPYWSRLRFRLLSADDPNQDATFKDTPLCGFLVPDLFEHALEVYDASGRALGQVRSDPPQRGSQQSATLNCWFEAHPWTLAEMGLGAADDPLAVIENQRLRSLVEGVAAQGGVSVPPSQPKTELFETGLTALMRIIDTLRPSIDPKQKVKDRKVRLTGDPIAVLAAGVWLEATGETAAEALKGDPPPPAQPPALPTLQVRIGDQSRPDDGVLGCFLPGPEPAAGRFAPVDAEAAEKAILNELPSGGITEKPANHPFVAGLECAFPVALGDKLDLTVLVEAGAGLHAVCGALPRKKIVVPKEFLAGVERLQPTFRVGPLLSIPSLGALNPILPTPQVEGHDVEWVRYEPGEDGQPGEWLSSLVPPLPPVGAVPPARAGVSEGWMRLTPRKEP